MSTLISRLMENALWFFLSVFLLKSYFDPKLKFFFKNKKPLVLGGLLLIYAIYGFTSAYIDYSKNRIPKIEKIQAEVSSNKTFVEEDFELNFPEGYSLTIPAGYSYTVFRSGAVSMTAIKETGNSAIVVATYGGNGLLQDTLRDALEMQKSKYAKSSFPQATEMLVGSVKALRVDFSVEKDGIPMKGILILAKPADRFFQLNIGCPASNYTEELPTFEKVLDSLKFQ